MSPGPSTGEGAVAGTDAAFGAPAEGISREELQLATRNSGTPLEALRHPLTPIGLHYRLIHYDIPFVDRSAHRLEVVGHVGRPLSLSVDELRRRPASTLAVTLECAGNGRAYFSPRPVSQPWLHEAVGTAEWTGVPVAALLAEADLDRDAVEVVFGGLDRGIDGGLERSYERSLPVAEARRDGVIVAYAMNGQPLPPQHGFPLRLVVPGWYGMASVKWLRSIVAVPTAFLGYHQVQGYRLRHSEDDVGVAVTRIEPRALMVPPGIPDFLTRRRILRFGTCRLEGRAWSGHGMVDEVEVSTDDGAHWHRAELSLPPPPSAWRGWSYRWEPARAGLHFLRCRARDASGRRQPGQAGWNVGGYLNTTPQRLEVEVVAEA